MRLISNYDHSFRRSSWSTLYWLISVLLFFVINLVSGWTIGHGSYLFAMLFPLYFLVGAGFGATNLYLAMRSSQVSAKEKRISFALSVVTVLLSTVIAYLAIGA